MILHLRLNPFLQPSVGGKRHKDLCVLAFLRSKLLVLVFRANVTVTGFGFVPMSETNGRMLLVVMTVCAPSDSSGARVTGGDR